MISHRLTLDYTLQPGWMAPFVEGVLRGQAMARRCTACDRTHFPPLRSCTCGQTEGEWTPLPGTAEILGRTMGLDGDFALVRFDGADSAAVMRVVGIAPDETRGEIGVPEGPLPMMILGPVGGGAPK